LDAAGFKRGYPLFSRPDSSVADELRLILHTLTTPERGKSVIPFDILIPDGSGNGTRRGLAIDVSYLGRSWRHSKSWRLTGMVELPPENERLWRVNRKVVSYCEVRALLGLSEARPPEAFVQLLPIGRLDQPVLAPTSDDFRWGDPSSKTLPPE
jgi:hypothetical protein